MTETETDTETETEITVASPERPGYDPQVVTEEHEHPGERQYVVVALVLAAFTAIEVSTYFLDFGWAAVPLLLTLMTLKFITVVAWFMHLKFDSRLFRRLFVAGLVTAMIVYAAALSMFHFWA